MEKPSIYDPASCKRYIIRQEELNTRREEDTKRIRKIEDNEDGLNVYDLGQMVRLRRD